MGTKKKSRRMNKLLLKRSKLRTWSQLKPHPLYPTGVANRSLPAVTGQRKESQPLTPSPLSMAPLFLPQHKLMIGQLPQYPLQKLLVVNGKLPPVMTGVAQELEPPDGRHPITAHSCSLSMLKIMNKKA